MNFESHPLAGLETHDNGNDGVGAFDFDGVNIKIKHGGILSQTTTIKKLLILVKVTNAMDYSLPSWDFSHAVGKYTFALD